MRVCLVTEELLSIGAWGGIGAAFYELATFLARSGQAVDVLYCPIGSIDRQDAIAHFANRGIKLSVLDWQQFAVGGATYPNKAYAVYRTLSAQTQPYDVIHFHDYKGLGFYCVAAKRQGIAFEATDIVMQLHGPIRWTAEANGQLFSHRDHLLIDFMERACIRDADRVVSPSAYLVDWLRGRGFDLPADVQVIRNLCSLPEADAPERIKPKEIILFGRHENRKGVAQFCDAIDEIAAKLRGAQAVVTFLGRLGEIDGHASGIWLTRRMRHWPCQVRIRTEFGREQAMDYLRSARDALVVIPSPEENSPYTVLEALRAGKPIITSDRGGARELIDPGFHASCLSDLSRADLSGRISRAIDQGIEVAHAAQAESEVEAAWLRYHEARRPRPTVKAAPKGDPSVVFGITHYERPAKVVDAILSAVRQSYAKMQVVVVDDGSRNEETRAALSDIEAMLTKSGGLLIRQDNAYLGAARNAIARATESDYLIFLDDDDIAFPYMVETLVRVAKHTGADIVNCLNMFIEEQERPAARAAMQGFRREVYYTPTGGPLASALTGNVLGASTALIKRSFFDAIGGYSELRDVGFEDYEFYVRTLQNGGRIEIVPEPLYFYEADKSGGMLLSTSTMRNFKRVIDAVDFAKDAAAWRDLAAVATGSTARHVASQTAVNVFSRSEHAALLQEIVDSVGDKAKHYAALAQYAAALGAPHVAQEWLANFPGEKERPAVPLVTALRRKAPPDWTRHATFREARMTAALGRADDAIDVLTQAIRKAPELDADMVSAVREIVRDGGAKPAALKALFNALTEAPAAPALHGHIAAAAVTVAMHGGLLEEVHAMLREIEALESAEYIKAHADLVAIPPARALEHFKNHGHGEGRNGFRCLTEIAAEVGRLTGRTLQAWHVAPFFDDRATRSHGLR